MGPIQSYIYIFTMLKKVPCMQQITSFFILSVYDRLIIHQRDHMGLEKIFCPFKTCPWASKEFVSTTTFNAHLKKHLDEKRKYFVAKSRLYRVNICFPIEFFNQRAVVYIFYFCQCAVSFFNSFRIA